ncbi:MAG TPA: ribosome small subunit-dependent GTPase A [Rhodanobacteraceae bacterium]|nr:ribosome small subunit-dependent GTPase A [Rhodanobacteraceae bacterium]
MTNGSTQSASTLRRIGWRGELPEIPASACLARVSAQHRAGYEVHDGEHPFNAQPAPKFLKRNLDPAERPAVGDFVIVEAGAPPHIVEVLPRRSVLARAAAGERYARQVIVANVDVVLVLTGLDGDFNPARIERYLALIEGSGARVVAVLTKLDKVEAEAADAAIATLRKRLPADARALAINAKDAASVAALKEFLTPAATAVLVGSSGAGKSTLINTLLGEDRMTTAATRASDDRGRHTTTHRALLPLPGGACLIDTPGMRELKLTGDEDLELFADIDALIEQCRFADCSHATEPGCAVREALDAGELDHARWRHYLKLHDQRDEQAARFEDRLRGTREPIRTHRQRGWQERE